MRAWIIGMTIVALMFGYDTAEVFAQGIPAKTTTLEARRDKLVKQAMALKGNVQYVHWKNRQEKTAPYKTDCSGYTFLVYRLANVGVGLINRDDDDQAKYGTKITKAVNLRKGDLVFYWTDPNDRTNVGHVGIFIGNGQVIHNAGHGKDVIVSNNNSSWYKTRFMYGRRVIK